MEDKPNVPNVPKAPTSTPKPTGPYAQPTPVKEVPVPSLQPGKKVPGTV